MGAKPAGVLSPDDLNETDARVLDVLQEGRVTPRYVADRLDVSRTYASERLKRLIEHNHVEKLASGLYELVDDPRGGTEPSRTPEDAQIRKLEERVEDLRAERDRLADQGIDTMALRRALDDVEAAAERGDGDALREALDRAREVLDDAE